MLAPFLLLGACDDELQSTDLKEADLKGADLKRPDDGDMPGVLQPSISVSFPSMGFEVWTSTYVAVATTGSVGSVEVWVTGEAAPRCTMKPTDPCFVDLGASADGPVRLEARAIGADGTQLASTAVDVTKAPAAADVCRAGAPGGTDNTRACVTNLVGQGRAAGYVGLTYENRDGMHSMAYTDGMDGLSIVVTDDNPAVEGGPSVFGLGQLPLHMDPSVILVGNASMAITQPGSLSLPRYSAAVFAYPTWSQLYQSSKIFWLPALRDYGKEDYFHYMAPYSLCSQGASGSERDELSKYLVTLAALRPEVREKLHAERALSPALQLLWRSTRVASDTEYMTQLAHLSAFNDKDNELAMLRRAQRIEVSDLPPIATLAVTAEDFEPGEAAFTTPESIARRWTSAPDRARMLEVSAESSRDLEGRPLAYFWRVLRGDPGTVDISPMNSAASRVRFTFRHHPSRTEQIGVHDRLSSLVVVALFVHDGHFLSAPVFVTSYTGEVGRYAPDDNQVDD